MTASEQVYDDEEDTLGPDLRHFDPAPVLAVIKRQRTTKRNVAERSGLNLYRSLRRGYLTEKEADRCAVALGYLPADLWPEWDDYVLDGPPAGPPRHVPSPPSVPHPVAWAEPQRRSAGMIIVVANVKGGVGKTTTACYLAAVAAEGDGPVVLVDADPQASAAEWLEEQPIEGVTLAEAPSERMIVRALDLGAGTTVIVDTPPGAERLVRAALGGADATVIPTKAGTLEVSRVRATMSMVPAGIPIGLVFTAARQRTRDYLDSVAAWAESGVPVWGSVAERVAVAAGSDGPLAPEALDAYRQVLAAVSGAVSAQ